MYVNDQRVAVPADRDAVIWRYLDLAKFVSLLEKRSVFFCRADKLGDPFEGAIPRANLRARESFRLESDESRVLVDLLERHSGTHRNLRKYVLVNCWHLNAGESDAMWRVYTRDGAGVAIRSTFARLAESFRAVDDTVYIGSINYDEGVVNEFDLLQRHLWKRRSFQHEHELRAIILDLGNMPEKDGIADLDLEPSESGRYIAVDIDTLIESVVVSPLAKPWFRDLVTALMGRYGLRKLIRPSALLEEPIF